VLRNQKLLEESIKLVTLQFGSYTNNIRFIEVFYIHVYKRLNIFLADKY